MKTKKQVKWEGVITNIQANVLLQLAKHKFLTLRQLLRLNVGSTQYKYIWKQVASLRDRQYPLVKSQRFSASLPSNGKPPERVEDLYYLSKEGAKALEEELEYEGKIKIPIGRRLAYKDYCHRKSLITYQIELGNWAKTQDIDFPFFDTYFDKEGNNRKNNNLRAKTRIDFDGNDFFIPDASFQLIQKEKTKYYLGEMFRGQDPKRTIRQLHQHGKAMVNRFTHRAYNIPTNKAYYIVLLFERAPLKNSVIERIQKSEPAFDKIEKYFRVKSLEDLEQGDFNKDWLTLHGSPITLF
jgi:hypothetical protein